MNHVTTNTLLGKLINIVFSFMEYKSIECFESYSINLIDHISKNFGFYGKQYFDKNNDDEVKNIGRLIKKYSKESLKLNSKKESIFYLILNYIGPILNVRNNFPVCRYDHVLEWTKITKHIDQDILITAYIAYKDVVYGQKRGKKYFIWPVIIDVYNSRLESILSKGMSENHFHLTGSSYIFPISWIDLMNNIKNRKKDFKKMESKEKKLNEENIITNEDFHSLIKKAALYRLYLFEKVVLGQTDLKPTFLICENIKIKFKNIQNKIEELKLSFGKKSYPSLYDKNIFDNIKSNYTAIPDYAIYGTADESNPFFIFSGERFILYKTFEYIFSGKDKTDEISKILYEYILIKNKFRKELIQSNKKIGFANFSSYQSRKMDFIKNKFLKDYVTYLAIRSSFYQNNLENLEVRWSPKNNKNNYQKMIKNITLCVPKDKNVKSIIHFIKKEDKFKPKESKYKFHNIERHHKLRKNIKKQTLTLNSLKEKYLKTGNEIVGIDAASNEIVCPPEVFSQAFRLLKNQKRFKNFLIEEEVKDLKLTYHVGEDFLDIITGLRNINEVLNFFDYSPGDRLGHALALGLDVEDYYKFKNYSVCLPAQELLDNVVWLLNKSTEYNIDIKSNLKEKLINKYKELFNKIYVESFNESYTYQEYYDSWKLRGDNPEAYNDAIAFPRDREIPVISFKENLIYITNIDLWRKYDFNYRFIPKDSHIRKNNRINVLYWYYHYDENIKSKGLETEILDIDIGLVELIKKIQKCLQFEISKKGIAIELNPTSNYAISYLDSLSKHPVANLFNLGLTYDHEELNNNPQLLISINTDDQGVFNTSLSLEYALLASVFEKKYNPSMVYDWLDRIREMGNEQSFI